MTLPSLMAPIHGFYPKPAGFIAENGFLTVSNTLEEGARICGNELTLAFTSCPYRKAHSFCALPTFRSVRLDLGESRLYGKHNQENICAAVMAAIAAGCDVQNIQIALNQFRGLSHRIEYVQTMNGVTYVDDSKATNVDAVYRALESFKEPVILIMGGRDKGGDYRILEKMMQNHVKHLILLGEDSELIAAALGNFAPTVRVSSMSEAVTNASSGCSPRGMLCFCHLPVPASTCSEVMRTGEMSFKAR